MKGLQLSRITLKLYAGSYLYFHSDSFHKSISKWISKIILTLKSFFFFFFRQFFNTEAIHEICICLQLLLKARSATPLSEKYFTSSSFLKDIFEAYRIQGWECCCYCSFCVVLGFYSACWEYHFTVFWLLLLLLMSHLST